MKTLNQNLTLNFLTIDRMKTRTTSLIVLFAACMLFLGMQQAQAQRLSATLNLNSLEKNDFSTTNGQFELDKSANVSLNLRYYTQSKIGFRAGVGVENLNYDVNSTAGVATDFQSKRKDLKGIFGVEWHPTLGKWMDIYPGMYVPITVVGKDLINSNIDNLSDGGFSAGLGAVLGVNIKVLKIFRAGVEFDAQYQNFKAATVDAVNNVSFQPYQRMNYTANFTFGIMI